MNFNKLFVTVDNLVGDTATFKGLTFIFEHGILLADTYSTGHEDDFLYICDFISHDDSIEPVSFAAKGEEELREQIKHYVLK